MDAPVRQLTPSRGARTGRWQSGGIHIVVLASFLVPIGLGLAGTMFAAFGCLPAVGGDTFSLQPWRTLFATPGIGRSIGLTVFVGLAATFLSFALAIGFCAASRDRMGYRRAEAMLAPLLAAPHAAMAIGLSFVLAPSGWIARLVSPWLSGWHVPPDVTTIGDSWGLSLIFALMVKEVPFLLLMIMTAVYQVPAAAHLKAARSLGYGAAAAWIKVVLPQIYPQIRLPIYAVLAFSLSVVDMALILGPSYPAPLSVVAFRWFSAPDVTAYFPAAAAGILQLAVVFAAIFAWRVGEIAIARTGVLWIARGRRGSETGRVAPLATIAVMVVFALGAIALIAMGVWSFAWTWRYPAALPDAWTLSTWSNQLPALDWPARNTLSIGLLSTAAAAILVIAWLESEDRIGIRMRRQALWLIYIPLVVPQISFLSAIQVLLIRLNLDGTIAALVWAHLFFVLPYVFLALADPWRALDPRFRRSAAALGASPMRTLFAVKLPLLLGPILIACAIGFSVSVAQYLPTLFAGNGRVTTLTTEAVTLASGADRRIVGVYSFLQSVLPFLGFVLALAIPALVFLRRRALLRTA